MSLRIRLALLYSSLTGGMLLIFGFLTYTLVGVFLLIRVDSTLRESATRIIEVVDINPQGEVTILDIPKLDLMTDVYVQFWNPSGRRVFFSSEISRVGTPLYPAGLHNNQVSYQDIYVEQVHLRVLSIPLQKGERSIGVLQVAATLTFIDAARHDMIVIVVLTAIASMLLAGLAGWFGLGRVLASLKTVTETALQITRADDLSRRIPYSGPEGDEIGQLIQAFNNTLERLESLFASQQRFLADVSHELRTPLTVIKGNADLMLRTKKADVESLSSIEEETDRLTRLVGDLLLLVQVESGKLPLAMKPMELDTLLLDVFKEMKILAHNRVKIKVVEIDQVSVNGDRDRLKQVLINLVSNAIKFTPDGGEIYLSLGIISGEARIIIRDTGPGIPAEDLPYIFDRFYRAEKSRTRSKTSGFGLGLSIAYWIINSHGGRIKVDSQEGKGTTFAIWLPVLPAPGEKPIDKNVREG